LTASRRRNRRGRRSRALEGGEDLVADRAVHHAVHVVGAAEDEGQRDDLGLLDEVVERPHRDAVEVDHAELRLLDRVLLLAELGRGEDLDAEPPAGALLEISSPMCSTAATVG
jgi:hypothetical protein